MKSLEEARPLLNTLERISKEFSMGTDEETAIRMSAAAIMFVFVSNQGEDFNNFLMSIGRPLEREQKEFLRSLGLPTDRT